MHDGEVAPEAVVQVPLSMMNRHGLIAGATGTGKTKTLQVIAEQLSAAGVPVFVADMKGDVSGLAAPGAGGRRRREAHAELGHPVRADRLPGRVPLARRHRPRRAGPRDGLGLRPAAARQGARGRTRRRSRASASSSATPTRRACRCSTSPTCARCSRFLDSDEGKAELDGIGGLSRPPSACCCARSSRSRTAAATSSSASRSSTSPDLLRTAPDGRGVISCLELPAVQDKPALFSTALMWLLAELFEELPEVGDLRKPKLVFFFDEAHLLFDGATKAFLDSVAQTVRLIRSKGVGVFFVTQTPKDVPGRRARPARQPRPARAARLHAGRREGAEGDRRDVPEVRLLRPRRAAHALGIGEAAVTILSREAACRRRSCTPGCCAPRSRMAPADDVDGAAKASPLYAKYGTRVDASAREMLAARIAAAAAATGAGEAPPPPRSSTARRARRSAAASRRSASS